MKGYLENYFHLILDLGPLPCYKENRLFELILGRKTTAYLPQWSVTFRQGFDENNFVLKCKMISNDQELIQSDPISCLQNQKGNN